jgi:hypothetical protein
MPTRERRNRATRKARYQSETSSNWATSLSQRHFWPTRHLFRRPLDSSRPITSSYHRIARRQQHNKVATHSSPPLPPKTTVCVCMEAGRRSSPIRSAEASWMGQRRSAVCTPYVRAGLGRLGWEISPSYHDSSCPDLVMWNQSPA